VRRMKQQKSRKGTRIIKRRTPRGRTAIHYVKKKPRKASCALCGALLGGIPNALPSELKKMTRSQRRVSRIFGGVLCSRCTKRVEKYRLRMEEGVAIKRDLRIEKFLPRGWYASLSVKAKVKEAVAETGEETAAEAVKETGAKKAEKPKKTATKAAAKPKAKKESGTKEGTKKSAQKKAAGK